MKSGKQRRAREKEGTQMTIFPEPHPGRRRAGPPDEEAGIRQKASKFKRNGPPGRGSIGTELSEKRRMWRQFSTATHQAGSDTQAYATNENEENPNLNPKCVHLCQRGKERQAA